MSQKEDAPKSSLWRKFAMSFVLFWLLASVVVWVWIKQYDLGVDPNHVRAKAWYLSAVRKSKPKKKRPNIIFIVFDDLGYGDIGAYGAKAIRTPALDRLAKQGVRFTNFYTPTAVCSPSRAAMMTGRYPLRTGVTHALFPPSSPIHSYHKARRYKVGLPPDEITMAESLQAAGYKTALIGKWHLGGQKPSLPQAFGFDQFYGVLCSNDQRPMHLYRNAGVEEHHPVRQETLTRRYTREAGRFIVEHAKRPFFLYLAHTFPHAPLHVSKKQRGFSKAGLYGDVVEELDQSVGYLMKVLKRLKIAKNTLVVVTSDNGPWYQGDAGGLRGRKWEVFEGGVRIPLIMRWPNQIKASRVIDKMAMNIDLFPSFLDAAGVALPKDRVIDGKVLWPVLKAEKTEVHDALFFFWRKDLYAARQGQWKFHQRHRLSSFNPIFPLPWGVSRGPWLFDLSVDVRESYDVSEKYKERVAAMQKLLEAKAKQFRSNPRGWLLASPSKK